MQLISPIHIISVMYAMSCSSGVIDATASMLPEDPIAGSDEPEEMDTRLTAPIPTQEEDEHVTGRAGCGATMGQHHSNSR